MTALRSLLSILALLFPGAWEARTLADDFARIEGQTLLDLAAGKNAKERSGLTFGEIDALPKVLADVEHGLVIVRTDRGNAAKLLVSPALRKPEGAQVPAVPVVVIERFETYETPKASPRLAQGKTVVLFDGFQFDLETGQVVPEGYGGDLKFDAKGKGLVAIHEAKLLTLDTPPTFPKTDAPKLSPGRQVVPSDFEGQFHLYANAQWSGILDLKVDPEGAVSGQFKSDASGRIYKLKGSAGKDSANHIQFTVELPRARQEFDGRLWTNGKGGMAGEMTFLDQKFGFFAVREGTKIEPVGAEE